MKTSGQYCRFNYWASSQRGRLVSELVYGTAAVQVMRARIIKLDHMIAYHQANCWLNVEIFLIKKSIKVV